MPGPLSEHVEMPQKDKSFGDNCEKFQSFTPCTSIGTESLLPSRVALLQQQLCERVQIAMTSKIEISDDFRSAAPNPLSSFASAGKETVSSPVQLEKLVSYLHDADKRIDSSNRILHWWDVLRGLFMLLGILRFLEDSSHSQRNNKRVKNTIVKEEWDRLSIPISYDEALQYAEIAKFVLNYRNFMFQDQLISLCDWTTHLNEIISIVQDYHHSANRPSPRKVQSGVTQQASSPSKSDVKKKLAKKDLAAMLAEARETLEELQLSHLTSDYFEQKWSRVDGTDLLRECRVRNLSATGNLVETLCCFDRLQILRTRNMHVVSEMFALTEPVEHLPRNSEKATEMTAVALTQWPHKQESSLSSMTPLPTFDYLDELFHSEPRLKSEFARLKNLIDSGNRKTKRG